MSDASRRLLGRMGRLVRKEVSTILRDRRTIITLFLMPLLLYPLLTIAFRQFLLASGPTSGTPVATRIGVRMGILPGVHEAEEAVLFRLLVHGEAVLQQERT